MTPLCVALIRIALALGGQDDDMACSPYPAPATAPVPCCPQPYGPSPTATWTAVGVASPMPNGSYYALPSPCVPQPPAAVSVSPGYAPAPGWSVPAAPSPDEAVVKELIRVLNDTASKETFCLTLEVLVALKGDRKPALPAVLRNAERLGISPGILKGPSNLTSEQELLLESLQTLTEGKSNIRPASTPKVSPAPAVCPPIPSSLAPALQLDPLASSIGWMERATPSSEESEEYGPWPNGLGVSHNR